MDEDMRKEIFKVVEMIKVNRPTTPHE